jgi:hypothetical protein
VVLSSAVSSTRSVVSDAPVLELLASVVLPSDELEVPTSGEHTGDGGSDTQPLLLLSHRLQYGRFE